MDWGGQSVKPEIWRRERGGSDTVGGASMGAGGLGVLAVVAAAALWGSTGTVQALLPDARDPLVVGAARLALGAAALMALAALSRGGLAGLARAPRRPVLFAGLAIGLYNLLFFAAVARAGVGLGTAIAIGSAPVWVSLHDTLIRRRPPRGLRLLGQAVSIAGAALLVLSGGGAAGSALGMGLAALSGASYAAYSVATSRAASGEAPPVSVAAATFAAAALVAAPVYALRPVGWAFAPDAWPLLLGLGVFSTGVAYAFYTWGLRHVAAATAVTLALVEPLTAWLLATLVVGEPVTLLKAAGALMLLAGLALTARDAAKR